MSKHITKTIRIDVAEGQKEVNINVTPTLSELLDITNEFIFAVTNEYNDYVPLLEDYFFRLVIVSNLTDFDLPNDPDESYELLYNTDIYAKIISVFDEAFLTSFHDSCIKKLEFELCKIKNRTNAEDLLFELTGLVEDFRVNFDIKSINDFMKTIGKLNEMTNISKDEIVKTILKFRDNN